VTGGNINTRDELTLLICHAGTLGDFILTWPALRGIKQQYPQYKLIAVGRMHLLNLAVKYGLLDEGFDLESRQMLDFFQGDKIPAILGRPAGAILWLKNADKITKLLIPVCPRPVVCIEPFPSTRTHLASYYCSELQRYYSVPNPVNILDLLPEPEKYKGEDRYAVVHPGSGSPSKNFRADFYLQLGTLLQSYGFKKVYYVLGTAESADLDKCFPAAAIVRPQDLLELSEWLARAGFFTGNDSGVSHLAGFLGVPAVVFYRTTDPAVWGVLGKRVWHIQTDEAGAAKRLFTDRLEKFIIKKFV
jgi:hypothetical protein